jgi:hypothetical protein
MELYGFKMKKYEKENEGLLEQLERLKIRGEKQREEELDSLKAHLTITYRDKIFNQKKEYESKIEELEKRLIEAEVAKDNDELQLPKLKAAVNNDIL